MGILIHSFQLLERRVGIDLGGGDALMSQQLAYALQSCPIVQHGGGKRVAQHVRRAFLQRGHFRQISFDDRSDLRSGNTMSLVIEQQGFLQPQRLFVTLTHIFAKRLLELFTKGNDALLVPLSRDLQLVRHEVYIPVVQPH